MKRNVLVVGGSSGIGLEVVRTLHGGGHQVYSASRREADSAVPTEVVWRHFDATERTATLELPESLDGLVYCPGTIRLAPFGRLSDDDFLAEYETNFLGAVRTIRLAQAALKKSEAASIVLFSTVAVGTGLPYHAGIASAKGAVEGLMRTLAAEFAPKIRVNCLALSLTDTPLAGSLLSTDEKRRASADRHPLRRIGDPGEVAKAVAFLLGPEAGFMTGQVLKIDGGLSSIKLL